MQQERSRKINKEEQAYLDTLQRESWNLELIISGLALFGLVALNKYVSSLATLSSITSASFMGGVIFTGALIVYFCAIIVFTNLVIHLVLRGLWIGAVGLRSVSGDINFYQLRLQKVFNRFLRKRIRSFDHYVINLDRFCSLVFAFSFLLVLLLFGCISFFTALSALTYLFEQFEALIPEAIIDNFTVVFTIIYLLFGLLYFFDFLSLGRIKRVKWLSRIYYPFYRFFGFITLARVYRPIYYNFIDDKFGRKMVLLSIPYIALVMAITSISPQGGAFYDEGFYEDQPLFAGHYSQEAYYENLRSAERKGIPKYLLSSDVVSGTHNKLSIFITPYYSEIIEQRCEGALKLHEWVVGSEFVIGFSNAARDAATVEANQFDYISCFKDLFELQLNGVPLSMADAILYDNDEYAYPKLVKYIPLQGLPTGIQQLAISRLNYNIRRDSMTTETLVLPFYYAPDRPVDMSE